ncbi:hypothetical protein AURDEDRAFT_186645 [Auricularia subglabra TFB-10046 SS5]|nr:hypothetical protein AURDEDRAFT_186645 [Auricularia subglabra TFB-10046 SS5]
MQVPSLGGAHRRVCRLLPAFLAGAPFQRLAQEKRTDALLFTHLLAAGQNLPDVLDLLPHSQPGPTPPTPLDGDKDALYARFENNNFVLHSHLTPLAAAVYPAASRSLNHSCASNAVPLFVFAPATPPRMEVVLVRDVAPGDEITIPYIDPALAPSARRERLRASYGFECACARCITPSGLEAQIPDLAERFTNAAHDGPFDAAVAHGEQLLALYRAVYPPFYPLIGLHLAELAKTAWNAALRTNDAKWLPRAAEFVREALDALGVLGDEGDAPHPREELRRLAELLAQEDVRV